MVRRTSSCRDTCSSQWRRDARVLGSPPSCALMPPTLFREYLLSVAWQLLVTSGSWDAVSSGCQPGVRVVPFLVWSVLGSPPFLRPLREVTLFQRGTAIDNILNETSQLNNVGVHP